MAWLFAPVDNTPLVLFRMLFGLLLAVETAGAIGTGWVHENLIDPRVPLPMVGFELVRPLPGAGMYAYFALMAACGLLVMLGAFYRPALALFTLLWSATYVMQSASYNNHYYLMILLCLLMLPTPAHAWASWDARRRPELRSVTCPRWCIAALIAQVAIVYEFAALAKLDADWLAGRPLALWLPAKADWLFGPLYVQPWLVWVLAYGGIAFDALIVPLLLWRRTRLFAVGLGVVFHLFNSITFRIGIFPYLAIALCVLFFPGEQLRRWFLPGKPPVPPDPPPTPPAARQALIAATLALYFTVQLALPLRHLCYPGNVNWTEEGHRMAWRMMLRDKSGTIVFLVRHPASGREWRVRPSEFLSAKQAERIAVRPDLIWQFARFLVDHYAAEGLAPVEIRARSRVSLNGRPPQPLVDPNVDLATADWPWFRHASWIAPLEP